MLAVRVMKPIFVLTFGISMFIVTACGGSNPGSTVNNQTTVSSIELQSSAGASLGYALTVNTDSVFVHLTSLDRYITLDQRTGLPPVVATANIPTAMFEASNCGGDAIITPRTFQGEVGKTIYANNSKYYLISTVYPISVPLTFASVSDASGNCSNTSGPYSTFAGTLRLTSIASPIDLSNQAPLVLKFR